jgi:hypothetical protein
VQATVDLMRQAPFGLELFPVQESSIVILRVTASPELLEKFPSVP